MSAGTGEQAAVRASAAAGTRARAFPVSLPFVALHLAALWAFAAVQPLFELLGDQAQFFVARGNTTGDIVVFALVFTLVPPALMTLAVWLVSLVRTSVGWAVHLVLVAVLVAMIVLPPLGDVFGGSSIAILPAVVIGVAAAALYARAAGVRSFLGILSPAPVLFLVLFLVFSPVSKLVFPSDDAQAVAGPASSDTPVVVVLLDELPTTTLMGGDDRLDETLFPSLASLAEDATWYRNATTVADGTTEAVPAILTGSRPHEGELPTAADHPRSLFTLLARSHRFDVAEPITDVCPERLCGDDRPDATTRLRELASDLRIVSLHLLLPDDLRDGLPAVDRNWEGFDDEAAQADQDAATPDRAQLEQQVIGKISGRDPAGDFARVEKQLQPGGSRPPFVFVHAALPHGPWNYLPDGRQYALHRGAFPGMRDRKWVQAPSFTEEAFKRHMVQAQYADRLVGSMLERLRATGIYDDALVVVAADHGVTFRPGQPYRGATREDFADIAGVPLLIKSPGQKEGRIDDAAVRTIDIVPTIADELGVRLPWKAEGMPVDERDDDPSTRIEVSHGGESAVTVSFADFLRTREERQRFEASLVDPEVLDRKGPWAIGPRPELVGRRVASFETLPRGSASAQLDGPDAFAHVREEYPLVPAFVSGGVRGLDDGALLAVAVNGRVAATARVQTVEAKQFMALVSPDSFREGANRVEVYAIEGDALRLLARTAAEDPYRLVEENGAGQLARGDETIPVTPDSAVGYVDNVVVEGEVVTLNGWAASAGKRPADRIVLMVGDESVSIGRPTVDRPDLKQLGRHLGTAGYQVSLPAVELKGRGPIRMFAIAGGEATELPEVANAPAALAALEGG